MKKRFHIIIVFCFLAIFCHAQTWSSCGLGIPLGYPPKALFADTISNKLYASGFGSTVDGTLTVNGVASWDGTKWDSLGHGALGTYTEFLIRYNNKLYLQKADRIYAWDFNSLKWDSVPGGHVGGEVKTAVVYNNDLILAGEFSNIGGVIARNVMRFDGTNFTPVGNLNFSLYIRGIEVFQNEIYIGGYFGNDTIHGAIAKFNGTQWVDVDGGFRLGGGPEVTALKVYNNRLYAGGVFYGTKDRYMPSIAAWDGVAWNNAGAGIYYNSNPWGVVYKLHVWNNKLLVCGNFDRAGNMDVFSLAFWNDTNWCKTKTTPESLVWTSAIFQNTLYIGEHLKLDNDSVHNLGYWIGGDFIDSCGSPVGIHERYKNNLPITLYPNPANTFINFKDEKNDLQNATLEIINTLGQTLLSIPYEKQINVSMLQDGFYNIKIKTDQGLIYNSKFIKE